MLKRTLLLTALLCVIVLSTYAQQKPQYTQYIFNNFLLNPAVAGIENYTDVKLGHRSQWSGLEGAPVTAYLTINAPIGNNFTQGDATSFPSGGDNPYSRLYTQDYRAAEPHHGIGFMLVTDKAGPIEQTNMAATYAYHIGLAPRLNLAVGVSAGVNHLYLNTALITLEYQYDFALTDINNNQWKPDAGVGVWLYSSDYYVGVSAQQIIPQNQFFTTGNKLNLNKSVPHYFATAGYKLYLSDDVTLLPSALLKFIEPAPTSFDINMKISFRDKFWFGGSYRRDDSFGVLAGFNLNSLINVSYSYDVTTSALNTVSNGSHEIVLGIMLNNRYKLTSPQHGW
jgi:type IX secretion system PorP/SprF family membrane protein